MGGGVAGWETFKILRKVVKRENKIKFLLISGPMTSSSSPERQALPTELGLRKPFCNHQKMPHCPFNPPGKGSVRLLNECRVI